MGRGAGTPKAPALAARYNAGVRPRGEASFPPDLARRVEREVRDEWATVVATPPLPAPEEVLELFADAARIPLGDPDLDGLAVTVPVAIEGALGGLAGSGAHRLAFEKLAEMLEGWTRRVLFLVDRPRYERLIRPRPKQPRPGLGSFLEVLGVADASILGAPSVETLRGHPRLGRAIGLAYTIRNSVHQNRDWSNREIAEGTAAILAVYLYVGALHRDALRAAIRDQDGRRGALQAMAERLQSTVGRAVDLDATELAIGPEDDFTRFEAVAAQGPTPIAALLERHRRLLLLGPPGAGKTTTLRCLALALATRALAGEPTTPLLIPLASLADAESLPDRIGAAHGATWERDLARGELVLLLDGLNEVSATRRYTVLRDLDRLLATPGARIVVTSRDTPYAHRPGLVVAFLDLLRDPQMHALLALRLPGPGDAGRFAAALARWPRLWAWGRNPMMLAMLAASGVASGGSLPDNRGRLVEGFVTRVLDREARKGSVVSPVLKQEVLADVAFHTRQRGQLTFRDEQFLAIARKTARELGAQVDCVRLLEEVLDGRLLMRDPGGRLAFEHELYQEYFAARHLAGKYVDNPSVLTPLLPLEEWREPITLLHGLLEERGRLFETLLDVSPALAARTALAEREPEEQVLTQVARATSTQAESDATMSRIGDAVTALIALGRPDEVRRLLEQAAVRGDLLDANSHIASGLAQTPDPFSAALDLLAPASGKDALRASHKVLSAMAAFPGLPAHADRSLGILVGWADTGAPRHFLLRLAGVLGLADDTARLAATAEAISRGTGTAKVPGQTKGIRDLAVAASWESEGDAIAAADLLRRTGPAYGIPPQRVVDLALSRGVVGVALDVAGSFGVHIAPDALLAALASGAPGRGDFRRLEALVPAEQLLEPAIRHGAVGTARRLASNVQLDLAPRTDAIVADYFARGQYDAVVEWLHSMAPGEARLARAAAGLIGIRAPGHACRLVKGAPLSVAEDAVLTAAEAPPDALVRFVRAVRLPPEFVWRLVEAKRYRAVAALANAELAPPDLDRGAFERHELFVEAMAEEERVGAASLASTMSEALLALGGRRRDPVLAELAWSLPAEEARRLVVHLLAGGHAGAARVLYSHAPSIADSWNFLLGGPAAPPRHRWPSTKSLSLPRALAAVRFRGLALASKQAPVVAWGSPSVPSLPAPEALRTGPVAFSLRRGTDSLEATAVAPLSSDGKGGWIE